jgi:pimeloyl-ACP methyl ester carboxylesterase
MTKTKKHYLWTKLNARLLLINANNEANYNWIFVPGGPGLGSEYLDELTKLLHLPGTVWHFDFPDDGSNVITINTKPKNFRIWSQALIEAVSALNNVILVTHSFSGMLALSIPELENLLSGLVLMDSAPDKSWQQAFQQYVLTHPLATAEIKNKIYTENQSNEALKEAVIAGASYCVTTNGLKKFIATIRKLPINYKSYEWYTKNFHSTYKFKWIPKDIPTLIFAGDHDHITPLKPFSEKKQFIRKNILIAEITNAGHYPWIENLTQVKELFNQYCKILLR